MFITVSIPTYNRCALLGDSIRAILAQQTPGGFDWELLVVDNNSSDGTRAVIESIAASHPRVRYAFEPEPGVSCARNCALREARGEIVAFTDDDIQPAPDWLANIARTAAEHPEWAVFGGKVLPLNRAAFPSWLTPSHYSPLALLDRGDKPHALGMNTGLVVGANFIVRKALLAPIGEFDPRLGLIKRRLGGIEDEEMIHRALQAGLSGAYVPSIAVQTEVQEERLHWYYHLRWHWGHAYRSSMRSRPDWEKSSYTFLRTPGHVWRQALTATARIPLSLFQPEELLHNANRIVWAISYIRYRVWPE